MVSCGFIQYYKNNRQLSFQVACTYSRDGIHARSVSCQLSHNRNGPQITSRNLGYVLPFIMLAC